MERLVDKKPKEFKFRFKDCFSIISSGCFYVLIAIILSVLSYLINDDVYFYWAIALFVFIIPAAFFFFKYLFFDASKKVLFYYEEKYFEIYKSNTLFRKIDFKEVKSVWFYRRCKFEEGNLSAIGIENYYYLDFILKSKEKIRFTCLTFPKLELLPFPKVFFKELLPLPKKI